MSGVEETECVADEQPETVDEKDKDDVCESEPDPELQKLAVFDMMDAVEDFVNETQLVGE